jgi:hypothetical protein
VGPRDGVYDVQGTAGTPTLWKWLPLNFRILGVPPEIRTSTSIVQGRSVTRANLFADPDSLVTSTTEEPADFICTHKEFRNTERGH